VACGVAPAAGFALCPKAFPRFSDNPGNGTTKGGAWRDARRGFVGGIDSYR
jgi:hypothetical protein